MKRMWDKKELGGITQATETKLGGIKASPKTGNETAEVKIDTASGKLFAPAGGGGGTEYIEIVGNTINKDNISIFFKSSLAVIAVTFDSNEETYFVIGKPINDVKAKNGISLVKMGQAHDKCIYFANLIYDYSYNKYCRFIFAKAAQYDFTNGAPVITDTKAQTQVTRVYLIK